jgi:hypothetical protein
MEDFILNRNLNFNALSYRRYIRELITPYPHQIEILDFIDANPYSRIKQDRQLGVSYIISTLILAKIKDNPNIKILLVGQRRMGLNLIDSILGLSNNKLGDLFGTKESSIQLLGSSDLLIGRTADIIILCDIRNSYEAHDALEAILPNGNIIILDSTIPIGFPYATLFLERL